MSTELLSGPPEPRPVFHVGVFGAADWADVETLGQLLLVLTAAQRETHRVALVSAGAYRGDPPIVRVQDDWSIHLVPSFGGFNRQDRDLCEWCHAALVIGPTWKWKNLIRLFKAAGKPVRVHTNRPNIPRTVYDPLVGL